MRLHELLDGLVGARPASIVEVRGDRDVDVRAIVHDSRVAERGALFACIPGETVDGHEYAAEAVGRGAVACVAEHVVDVDVPQVVVDSVRHVLGPLCAVFFGYPSRSMRVVGVTGTNGKTTTTYLLEAIARAADERAGIVGTTGARIAGRAVDVAHTTPEATDLQALLARMRDDGVRSVAMEVSSHALDQHRVDGTVFAVACFTNLSHDHLDYHHTIEAYFDAKARLFTREFTAAGAIGVDDSWGSALVDRAFDAGLDVCTYAIGGGDADVRARDIALAPTHSSFVIDAGGERLGVTTSLVGAFNVANVLGAFATARLAGYPVDSIVAGLQAPIVVPGRMERVDGGQPFTVIVDYAHTPDALASVLAAARPLANDGRVLVVYGCGGDRDRAKRPVMGGVASRGSDVAILTSDNSRSEDPEAIARDVLAGVPSGDAAPTVELDRRAAIRLALRAAKAGDVVVIAGKGHESGQTAHGVTVPFDDRIVAREELEARV